MKTNNQKSISKTPGSPRKGALPPVEPKPVDASFAALVANGAQPMDMRALMYAHCGFSVEAICQHEQYYVLASASGRFIILCREGDQVVEADRFGYALSMHPRMYVKTGDCTLLLTETQRREYAKGLLAAWLVTHTREVGK